MVEAFPCRDVIPRLGSESLRPRGQPRADCLPHVARAAQCGAWDRTDQRYGPGRSRSTAPRAGTSRPPVLGRPDHESSRSRRTRLIGGDILSFALRWIKCSRRVRFGTGGYRGPVKGLYRRDRARLPRRCVTGRARPQTPRSRKSCEFPARTDFEIEQCVGRRQSTWFTAF